MDILFPGPESYRKEKKKKPNSDQNTPPISDNTCQTIPPFKAEQDWETSQVKIIKPAPLTAETPDETSLSTSPPSDKSFTPKPPQTKSKFFSKNGGILKKQKDAFLDKMVSECEVNPKKDEDNNVQVVSTDEKHTEFFFKLSDCEGHGHKAIVYKSHFLPLRHFSCTETPTDTLANKPCLHQRPKSLFFMPHNMVAAWIKY